MSIIKLRLTIVLPGRVMMSKQECLQNPKENYEGFNVRTYTKNPKTKRYETTTFHVKVPKNRTAKQVINISKEAYELMIAKSLNKKTDREYCPYWAKHEKWYTLSSTQRLEAHLQRITEGLKGLSFSYVVFDE